ncbi:MAG: hypothetical protein NTY23_10535 [Chloroflexi bacterium]|nr:hypothetical protein [Chloroflexota bacterium]
MTANENPGLARRIAAWARAHSRNILIGAALLVLALWAVRGYIPALGGSLLPPPLLNSIERSYQVCITDIPVWPGEPRQSACGEVRVVSQSAGIVAKAARGAGVARAVCYQVDIRNPYWTTQGTTRHEVVWHGRRVSKVAILKNGEWVVFPDTDVEDAERWAEFGCPVPYEVGATPDASPG